MKLQHALVLILITALIAAFIKTGIIRRIRRIKRRKGYTRPVWSTAMSLMIAIAMTGSLTLTGCEETVPGIEGGESDIAGGNGFPTKGTFYFHPDHIGSISYLTDSNGEVVTRMSYTPYGEKVKSASTGPDIFHQKYTGQVDDGEEAELMYYNARYYDPKLGRFISADSAIPDPGSTQAFNRYMYVLGNPVSFNDPTGHWGSLPGNYGFEGRDDSSVSNTNTSHHSSNSISSDNSSNDTSSNNDSSSPTTFNIGSPENNYNTTSPSNNNGHGGDKSNSRLSINSSLRQAELGTYKETQEIWNHPYSTIKINEMSVPWYFGSVGFTKASAGLLAAVEDGGAIVALKEGALNLHHSFPKFLGGNPKQLLTRMAKNVHQQLHSDLTQFLKLKFPGMVPSRVNPGFIIQENFTTTQRIDALSDFYMGPGAKYIDAARDFFNQIK